MTSLQFQRLHEHIRSCDARFESLVHHPCFLEYSHGALLQKEMINRIGPKVKQVWNVAYICYIFWGGWVVINTTAYHLIQYSLHLLVLPKELHDIFDCFNWCYYLGTCHWIAKGDDKEQTKEAKVGAKSKKLHWVGKGSSFIHLQDGNDCKLTNRKVATKSAQLSLFGPTICMLVDTITNMI